MSKRSPIWAKWKMIECMFYVSQLWWISSFSFPKYGEGNGNHSSVLARRIPGTGEPGGLPSMGLHGVGYDWCDLAAAAVRDEMLDSWHMVTVVDSWHNWRLLVLCPRRVCTQETPLCKWDGFPCFVLCSVWSLMSVGVFPLTIAFTLDQGFAVLRGNRHTQIK